VLDANTKDAHLERIRRDGYSIVENAIEPDRGGLQPVGEPDVIRGPVRQTCVIGWPRSSLAIAASGWHPVERDVLVESRLGGEAEDPLGQDIPQDLVGAAGDA